MNQSSKRSHQSQRPALSISIHGIPPPSSGADSFLTGPSWPRNKSVHLILSEELTLRLLQGWNNADPFAIAQRQKKARAAVTAAIICGVLTRPRECSACPSIGRIEAHHDDYSKPLEIQWLCGRCHVAADRARRLRDEDRPAGDNFAAFLLVNGAVELPLDADPPLDVGANGDNIDRRIRSFHFAGFDAVRRSPWVTAVLSCGHGIFMRPSELSKLPTTQFCDICTYAKRQARWERRELARRKQINRRASVVHGGRL